MNKYLKQAALFLILLAVTVSDARSQENENPFYFGIGTSISSFTGGEFGKRFGIRFAADDDDYGYNTNNYYYNKEDYENQNNSPSLSPSQFMLVGGVKITRFAALELETSLTWHSNGDIQNRDLREGLSNGLNYFERNANASLLAIPVIASLKIYPMGKSGSQFYLSGGYGIQFLHESMERIRDYYVPGYYYNSSYSQQIVGNYSQSAWLTGFKAAAGFSYNLFSGVGNEIELSYTSFKNNNATGSDEMLTINRSPNIGNISLGTKIYFSF